MVLGDEAFGRYLDHEIIDFIKQTSQSFPSAMQEYKKSATQKRILDWPLWHADLKLSSSRTMKNKFLLFGSYPVWYFVIADQMD